MIILMIILIVQSSCLGNWTMRPCKHCTPARTAGDIHARTAGFTIVMWQRCFRQDVEERAEGRRLRIKSDEPLPASSAVRQSPLGGS
jgi:hypothetical protein